MGARVGVGGAGLMATDRWGSDYAARGRGKVRRAEHLAVPLRRDGTHLATVEQDTAGEVDACILAVMRTPVGHLDHLPDFGTPPQAFRRGGIDLAEVERCVAMWEDRADVDALREDGELDRLARGVDHVIVEAS